MWTPVSTQPVHLTLKVSDDRSSSLFTPILRICSCLNGGTCQYDSVIENHLKGKFQVIFYLFSQCSDPPVTFIFYVFVKIFCDKERCDPQCTVSAIFHSNLVFIYQCLVLGNVILQHSLFLNRSSLIDVCPLLRWWAACVHRASVGSSVETLPIFVEASPVSEEWTVSHRRSLMRSPVESVLRILSLVDSRGTSASNMVCVTARIFFFPDVIPSQVMFMCVCVHVCVQTCASPRFPSLATKTPTVSAPNRTTPAAVRADMKETE